MTNDCYRMKRNKVEITPDTKVAELLRDYPELEDKLQQFSPAFAALKNPVLRRTVAKVTSLQQAAKVGGVSIVEMVNSLRMEAGMEKLENAEYVLSKLDTVSHNMPSSPIVITLDVRPIIDAGDQPRDAVIDSANKLEANQCMELISPFPPIPLIEALRKRGYKTTMHPAKDGVVKTYVEKE